LRGLGSPEEGAPVDSAEHRDVWPAKAAAVGATDVVVPAAAAVDAITTASDVPGAFKKVKAASGRLLDLYVTPPDALLVDAVVGCLSVVAATATSLYDAKLCMDVTVTDRALATLSDAADSVLLTRALRSTAAVDFCRNGCGQERGGYHRGCRGSLSGCLQGEGGAQLHALYWTCGGHRCSVDQRGGSSTQALSFRGPTMKIRGLQGHLSYSKKACDCGCTSSFASAAPTSRLHV